MNPRSLLAALLLAIAWAMPSEAAYFFIFNAGPPPGPGGERGGVNYQGPNNLSGGINSSFPFGISGFGTPSNSGRTISESGVFFGVFGGSGSLSIGGDFGGNVTNANVGPTGGSFQVNGFLSFSTDSFFGIPPGTALTGVVTIQLADPELPGGNGNKVGSLQLTLVAGPAPEPASLIMTGSGLAIALGAARARRRRRGG